MKFQVFRFGTPTKFQKRRLNLECFDLGHPRNFRNENNRVGDKWPLVVTDPINEFTPNSARAQPLFRGTGRLWRIT